MNPCLLEWLELLAVGGRRCFFRFGRLGFLGRFGRFFGLSFGRVAARRIRGDRTQRNCGEHCRDQRRQKLVHGYVLLQSY